ncbi:host cell division inhibitor Icd-like protein [Escherichia coli]
MLATTPTQKPQFIWIIAAVRRDCPTITAKIHHIAAESERDARRSLVRDHVCFFAGRIRTGGRTCLITSVLQDAPPPGAAN